MAVSPPRLPTDSANYYELLELPPFEPDAAKIQDRLREKAREFRKYQVGPYASQAETCLNQVALARRCLLDLQQKARYDERLRNEFDLPPLTVRASLPPTVEDSNQALPSARWSAIVARGLGFPGSVWQSLRQLLVKPQPPELPAIPESQPELAAETTAATTLPPVDAPWVTVPVAVDSQVSRIS